jgi:hypothetical protein
MERLDLRSGADDIARSYAGLVASRSEGRVIRGAYRLLKARSCSDWPKIGEHNEPPVQ